MRAVLVVVLVVAVGVALLWVFQRRLIYLPGAGPVPAAAAVAGPTARDVTVVTEDGLELGAWLVGPSGADRRVHVLFAAGNAGSRVERAPLARLLAAAGFTVLLLDYRGFGGNPGRPSEPGLAADARAGLRFLLDHAGARAERLLYVGESLGAAVVTGLAVDQPPAGMLLRSPFTDLAAVGQRAYPVLPVRLMLWDRFDVLGTIGRVRAPTVVVYGDRDGIVPPEQSARVAAAAPGLVRAVAVPGADHNDEALLTGDELVGAVIELADRCCPPG
ncbi:alpha/beta hydrolase [Pseudonocardia acaciae]|uniref:alpha/beta hydrolase n=1 Tax=Pseudonocardia acaciae TaxID=551276 RepID=UPI00048CA002|nr:alpha/beta hydrolase [Pseudonocardia acaciae]